MASRASLNKVLLIGNLTRDPELRYTPSGNAVCTFGLATNRSWTSGDGEKKEETEFHRVVSWNKLAELCSQLLIKGRKIFAEGRLQTRSWQTPDGQQRQVSEIVISDMRILDSKRPTEEIEGLEELDKEIGEDVAVPKTEVKPQEAEQPKSEAEDKSQKKGKGHDKLEEEAQSKTSKKQTKEDKSQNKTEEEKEKTEEDILKDLPF